MPEEVERAPADRHATWVALRTLRQRPTGSGRTASGETVYEVGSVQALLAGGASHFSRLVQCAKCGRDVAGAPLMSAADLDRPPNPVFCGGCVRAAPSVATTAPPPPPAQPRPARPAVPESGAVLAAIEARLTEVTRRVKAAPTVDPRVAALAEAVTELRGELKNIADSVVEVRAGMAATLDTQRREIEASLAEAQRELRAEVSALKQQTREEAAAIAEQIATQRGEMEQALEEVVQRTLAAVAPPLEELKGRQQALEAKLSETQTKGVADEASIVEAVEQAQAQAAGDVLKAVSDPLRDLTRGHQDTERRLDELMASIDAGASRHHLLEQRLNEYIERSSRMVDATPEDDPETRGRSTAGILQALELQLRAAEERIAQR